jgi:hypothetical protein
MGTHLSIALDEQPVMYYSVSGMYVNKTSTRDYNLAISLLVFWQPEEIPLQR